jgi:hypothetical protein
MGAFLLVEEAVGLSTDGLVRNCEGSGSDGGAGCTAPSDVTAVATVALTTKLGPCSPTASSLLAEGAEACGSSAAGVAISSDKAETVSKDRSSWSRVLPLVLTDMSSICPSTASSAAGGACTAGK